MLRESIEPLMIWYVTVDVSAQIQEDVLWSALAALGCERVDDTLPIPLAATQSVQEVVIEVEGPADLDQHATKLPGVLNVYPCSEMTPYDP